MARDHTKLRVFELADQLVKQVYRVTRKFPRDELFGLTAQMRRAAVSVPANIVEGCSRTSEKEYLHFLVVAKGSLQEVGYYLDLSHDLGFLAEGEHQSLHEQFNVCVKSLQSLITALQKAKGSGPTAQGLGLKA